jgi:protoporphyrinogen oxidase
MAGEEIEKLHLVKASEVKFGFVARVHKAYPIYDVEYAERVATIRGWLETIGNLIQVGRNGLHRYNNSDHSMLTAMRAVDNILLGTHHDIWAVNAESVYHEEHVEPEQPYKEAPETPAMEQPLASER